MASCVETCPSYYLDSLTKPKPQKKKVVKMAIPFNIGCDTCKRRINKGDKLRSLKKRVGNDPTFDVPVYRFMFKCPSCRTDFSIKSDPGRYDYVIESGGTLISSKF